jgi:myo-inositol-1(or 4)-monophosphatase
VDKQAALEKVSQIARAAGEVARQGFRHARVVLEKSEHDFVTDVDLRVDKQIISALLKEFPDFGIITEESGPINADREYVWIVDPIDGTRHFLRGIPIYSTALALKRGEELQLAAVYFPATDELFTAACGEGAWLDGEKIACSTDGEPKNAIACVDMPSRHRNRRQLDAALANLKKLMLGCQRARVMGLSSFGLCHVASGAFGAYVNLGSAPKEWDLAAGEMIAAEAGAVVTHTGDLIIAANKPLHDAIIAMLEV